MSIHYPAGNHAVAVTGQALSKNEYGTSLVLDVLPLGGEFGRKVFLSLTDETGAPSKFVDKTMAALQLLGWPGPDFATLDSDHPACYSMYGKQVECYCQHKNDNERWYVNTGGGSSEPVDRNDIATLNALFGRDYAQRAATTPAPQAAPVAQQAPVSGGVPQQPAQQPVQQQIGTPSFDAARAAQAAAEQPIPF